MKRIVRSVIFLAIANAALFAQSQVRPRAREIGIEVGVLPTGPLNTITDVAGVKVGQVTIIRGDNIRTGVTAILPHDGNLYQDRVPAAVFLGNAYGKLTGSTQISEMGEIETPILLTGTDSVFKAADAVITYMFGLKGNENVLSVNPVVGETNDGYLSDIRSRPITPDDIFAAISKAKEGPGPDELWRQFNDRRRADRKRAGADVSKNRLRRKGYNTSKSGNTRWFLHDRRGDGRAARSSQLRAPSGAGNDGTGTHGIE